MHTESANMHTRCANLVYFEPILQIPLRLTLSILVFHGNKKAPNDGG